MTLDHRISLHKLAVFSLVVELGSVSRAAERLVVSQPVVSAHLRSLEDALGCSLFETRAGRRGLTEAGEAAHRFAQSTLRATRELERRMAGYADADSPPVALAASMSLGSYRLSRVLAGFLLAHPEVELHAQIADLERIIESTVAGAIDLGFILGTPEAAEADVEAQLIGSEPLVLVAAPGRLPALGVTALAGVGLVEGHGGDGSDDAVRRALRTAGVPRRVVMELGHPEAVKRVVSRGVGAAFLPRSAVVEELERGQLEIVDVEGLAVEVPVHLLTRVGRELTELERELVEALRAEYARERLAVAAR